MHSKPRPRPTGAGVVDPIDAAIAALAGAQHGVVARRQLVALGMRPGAIQHRVAAGRLHRVHRGVFAVGHRRLTSKGRWMAAVLTCGDEALLSYRSAAALWGVAGYAGSWIDVTVNLSRRSRRDGIFVHGCRADSEDRAACDGIPVTSVARTVLDLAELVDRRRLERAVEAAERMRLLDVVELERVCARNPGRRGLRPLLALLPGLRPAPETRSELERDFVRFCRDAGLPPPVMNARVAGFEVDALWSREKLIVELDGYGFHGTRAAFERDRAKDAALQVAGHRVVRVTHRRLATEAAGTEEVIRRLLGERG